MAAPQRTKTLIYSTWRVEKNCTYQRVHPKTHPPLLVSNRAENTVKVNTCPLMLHYIKIYTNIRVCVRFYRELTSPITHTPRLIDSALALTLLPHQILKMLLFNSWVLLACSLQKTAKKQLIHDPWTPVLETFYRLSSPGRPVPPSHSCFWSYTFNSSRICRFPSTQWAALFLTMVVNNMSSTLLSFQQLS